jgi:hypothetical protein
MDQGSGIKEIAMKRSWALSLLLIAPLFTMGCGSSHSRQLQSITITKTANGQQIQFVATGTFSAPPTTVTPLPVDWTLGLMAPPPLTYDYTLTTQPYLYDCANAGAYSLPVVAFAPTDPNAPASGATAKVVVASGGLPCQ